MQGRKMDYSALIFSNDSIDLLNGAVSVSLFILIKRFCFMRFNTLLLLGGFAVASIVSTSPSSAQESGQDYLSFSAGYFDLSGKDSAIDFRAEYRPGHTYLNFVKPWAGVEVTSDASIWAGGGLLLDYEFTPSWYVTPSVGAGLYTDGGSDLDLDYPIQFRTQLEISHQYDSGHRAGVAISHMSNADLGDSNPGAEALSLYWSMPY